MSGPRHYRRDPVGAAIRWTIYSLAWAFALVFVAAAVVLGGMALLDMWDATGAANAPGVR